MRRRPKIPPPSIWLSSTSRALRLIVAGLAIVGVAAGLGVALSGGESVRNPLAGDRFFVDPASPVLLAARAATTPPAQARALRQISSVPSARWFGDWIAPLEVTGSVKEYVQLADRAHRVPVLVVYDIPHRDCSGASRGGAATAGGYRHFVRSFVRGLGDGPAVVIVEPDALAQLTCLSAAQRSERTALLRFAVHELDRKSAVVTYLDGGNSQFVPAEEMARRLESAGVDEADGFSLNVSNYFATGAETAYGKRVSAAAGGAHFVIDTSRNGRGAGSGALAWCNPGGRALGHAPTTDTGDPLVDAWLWVKTPGVSDGPCGGAGAPPAGQFWLSYALGLVANSRR